MKTKIKSILTGFACLLSLSVYSQAYLIVNSGGSQVCGNVSGTVTLMSSATVIKWEVGTFNGTFKIENTIETSNAYYNYTVIAPGMKAYRAYCSGANGLDYTNVIMVRASEAVDAGTISTSDPLHYQGVSGAGTISVQGVVGTPRWLQRTVGGSGEWETPPAGGSYNNLTRTTEFKVYVANSDYSCTDESNIITINVHNTGTLTGPSSTTEGEMANFSLTGNTDAIERWEFSYDGGITWTHIPSHPGQTQYSHLMSHSMKVRVLVRQGPVSPPLFSNTVDVAMIRYAPDENAIAGENYVREQVILTRGITDQNAVNNLPVGQKQQVTTYRDGFGRPVQQNIQAGSPLMKDLIQPLSYDHAGGKATQYNPYVSSLGDGSYAADAFTDQLAYYNNGVADKVQDDAFPFAKTVFENSPLHWVKEKGAQGEAWQPGNGHTIRLGYETNEENDVRLFLPDGSSAGFYDEHELMRLQQTDQDGKKTEIFRDKTGRTVLSRVQLDETVNGSFVPWLETYFIYNSRGAIRYMISPKGVAALKASAWSFTASIKDQYVNEFVYDARGRLVEKKAPGQAVTYFCYDRLDRLVLQQDGNLRGQHQWYFTKYDRQGRAVMHGLYTNTAHTSRTVVQQQVVDGLYDDGTDPYYEVRGTTLHGYSNQSFPTTDMQVQSVQYYDTYDFNGDGAADFSYTPQGLANEGQQGSGMGLPTGSKKLVMDTPIWLSSYIFYDAYGRPIQVRSNNHLSAAIDNLVTYVYNFSGNIVLQKTDHNAGGGRTTTVTRKMIYDHAGRIKQIYQRNNNDAGDVLLAHYTYNELGQLVDKKLHCTTCPAPDHMMDEPGGFPFLIERNQYNPSESELVATNRIRLLSNPSGGGFAVSSGNTFRGRISRSLADIEQELTPSMFLQSVDYRYDIRGALTAINNAQLTTDAATNDDTNDYFGMELFYNAVQDGLSNVPQFNGNISAMKWKGPGTNSGAEDQNSHAYTYDKANRLKVAATRMFSGGTWTKQVGAFDEQLTYDLNGNINTLKRNHRKHELIVSPTGAVYGAYTAEMMDDLAYTYSGTVGDALVQVEDASGITSGFSNGATEASEYSYDVNGNVTADKNKDIDDVIYNVLGKPKQIIFGDGRKIEYTFDASGRKLTMKTFAAGSATPHTTIDYVDGFVYENNALSFFASPEGRVVKRGSALEYQYAIADHQGNTRVVFTSAAPVTQVTSTDFESVTNNDFQNYPTGVSRSQVEWYNHTSPSPPNTSSQLLTGASNSQVGVARNFKVYPGDKISIEAYAKYFSGASGTPNLAGFAAALTGAFGLSTASTGEAARAYEALNDYGSFVANGNGPGENTFPKAFVNILLFDKDFNFLDIAYEQIDGGEQPVGSSSKTAHDHMSREYTVKEAGYAYVYISNENPGYIHVYFDDVTVSYTPTIIIQYNEYYPYGLQASTSWTRENNSNNYLYNEANELNQVTGWYETMFRDYDPVLGRFMQVDPLAADYSSWSPYHYAFNNPVMFNDPSGAEGIQPGPPDWFAQLLGPRVDEATMSNAQWITYSSPAGNAGAVYAGPTGSYMAQAYAQIQGTEAWNREMNLRNAASGGNMDAIRELARRNGDLIEMEHWVYEGGTIVDGVKHPTEQYDFWAPEGQQGDPKPLSHIEVLQASSQLDIFRETTFYPSPTSMIIETNTVYIEYDKSGKIKVINGFKTTQKALIHENKSIWGPKDFGELSISAAMKNFISEVENSVYHCFGCRTDPTVWNKYWDFTLSPNDPPKKNRLNSSAPHR